MKINWKVRLKNPVFWATVIPAVIALIYTVLGLLGVVPAISESTLVNAFSMLISALTALGVLVDPTTKGASDSERALNYTQLGGVSDAANETNYLNEDYSAEEPGIQG